MQPKLKIKNTEILSKYNTELSIPEGKECSSVIIGIIGEEKTSKSGKMKLIPVVLFQKRTDVGNSSSASDVFFRGFGETIIRHIENVKSSIFQAQNFKEGMILESANLAVDYKTEPFYFGQDPLINPSTGEIVTSNGKNMYRNTRTVFGPAEHTGLSLKRDEQVVEEVTESVSLSEEATF